MELIQQVDFNILNWIQMNLKCGFLDIIMPAFSALSDNGEIWLACGLGLLILRRYRKQGALMVLSVMVCVVIGNLILKPVIARPRPCWINENIPLLIESPTDYSFPSGHTLISAVGAVSVFMANRKFGWIAFPLAAVIAFSRLYLYVHFPSDVLVGAAIGTAVTLVIFKFGGKLYDHILNEFNKLRKELQ